MPPTTLKDRVLFNTAPTLTFEAPEGRPSSNGTFTAYDPRYEPGDTANNPIVTGTATLLSVDTTLSAASGASETDPKKVNVTPPAALKVGHHVLIAENNRTERGEVVLIASAYILLADPLAYDYTTAATFKSALMTSPAIPTSFTGDEDNLGEDYYGVWVYTVSGTEYTRRIRFDIVREVFQPNVTDADIQEYMPDVRRLAKFVSHQHTIAPLIRAAVKKVESFLVACEYDPDKLRDNGMVRQLVILATLQILAENGIHPNGVRREDYIEERTREFERYQHLILDGKLKLAYDKNEDDLISDSEKRVSTSIGIIR